MYEDGEVLEGLAFVHSDVSSRSHFKVIVSVDELVFVLPPAVRLPRLSSHHGDSIVGLVILQFENAFLCIVNDKLHAHPCLLPLDSISEVIGAPLVI